MVATTALAVFTGDRAPESLIQLAKELQTKGLRVATLTAPVISEALTSANVPHIDVSSPSDVALLLADRLELVIALPPVVNTSDASESMKSKRARLSAWITHAHAFVHQAAWNHHQIAVVLDETTLPNVASKISTNGSISFSVHERRALAEKAFTYCATLNQSIASLLNETNAEQLHDVLVIGGGGREHAIAWKLAQSPSVRHVYVAPGNAGTSTDNISNVNIATNCYDELVAFAVSKKINVCVVGPEAPLVDGLADLMNAAGIPTFGASAKAAQLEASKAFSKDFMARHQIPTATYQHFSDYNAAKSYVASVNHPLVVKASGIAAGKGVLIPQSKEETYDALEQVMVHKAFGAAGEHVVLEECLIGEEVSLLAFSDGEHVVTMPGAQDHKRVWDGDRGPNTGGMGVYCPAPCLTPALERECIVLIERVIKALKEEGMPYVGVLYPGFMLTPQGPKILEFNCRFGDPETQVLLPLLNSDLYAIVRACVDGTLTKDLVQWKPAAAVTVVMASEGYPASYPKNKTITGLSTANQLEGVTVFHAGTTIGTNNSVVTSGGRVLAVTAVCTTLNEAIDRAYEGVAKIQFEGMQYRRDIGMKGLPHRPIKLAVLGSTRGSSLQPILDAMTKNELPGISIEVVLSNKEDAHILERAKQHNIEAVAVNAKDYASRTAFDAAITTILEQKQVDYILLIGYMRIVSSSFCQHWKDRVLNVHPSLLPEFAGGMDLAVHQAVLSAKKTKSGCTVHFVTEQVDGGPIAVQMTCPVVPTDTPDSLKARVQALEGPAFIHTLRLLQTNRLLAIPQRKEITYADAGVSIDAGNLLVERIKPYCKSTVRVGCDADLGGFGGLFDLQAAGYDQDTVLVACTDGVGTKLRVAQLAKQHDTVGIDLVAMCVNDLIVQGAEPLFFLDYYACGALDVEDAADVVKGIAEGCRQSKCGLIGGETAEMPSMYHDGDYDMAGFCVGAVRKSAILPLPIAVGYTVLGLASSGVHSNGFSLVRKLVEVAGLKYSDPCPFEYGKTLGEALLTPTKIYVQQLLPVVKQGLVHALAHITGGGLLENIPRVLTKDMAVELDCSSWPLLPVFKWLQKVGNISNHEIARTFNCGIGMVLIVPPGSTEEVIQKVEATGEKVYRMGRLVARGDGEQVLLNGVIGQV